MSTQKPFLNERMWEYALNALSGCRQVFMPISIGLEALNDREITRWTGVTPLTTELMPMSRSGSPVRETGAIGGAHSPQQGMCRT